MTSPEDVPSNANTVPSVLVRASLCSEEGCVLTSPRGRAGDPGTFIGLFKKLELTNQAAPAGHLDRSTWDGRPMSPELLARGGWVKSPFHRPPGVPCRRAGRA